MSVAVDINKEKIESDLESSFNRVLKHFGLHELEPDKYGQTRKQHKYSIGYDIETFQSLHAKLTSLGAVLVKTIEQDDIYFIRKSQKPSVVTETVCLRSETPYVDYSGTLSKEEAKTTKLIYKDGVTHKDRLDRKTRTLKFNNDDQVLEFIDMSTDLYFEHDQYQVTKGVRNVYRLETNYSMPIFIYVDRDVSVQIPGKESMTLLGNFIEIESNDQEAVNKLKIALGLNGEPINTPYIDPDDLIDQTNRQKVTSFVESENNEWTREGIFYPPYYYDATSGYVKGIDPDKIKGLTQQEIEDVKKALFEINKNFSFDSVKSRDGAGKYESFPKHDGFKHKKFISDAFANTETWRIALRGGKRIVFSVVVFKDRYATEKSRKGIFIHFIGSHDDYETWLDRHKA